MKEKHMELSDVGPVQVGGITYRLQVEPEAFRDEDGDRLNGSVEYDNALIRVANDMDVQLKRCVLLHELVHAMLYQSGYHDQKERMVLTLGYSIVELLRQNPRLVAYLTGG